MNTRRDKRYECMCTVYQILGFVIKKGKGGGSSLGPAPSPILDSYLHVGPSVTGMILTSTAVVVVVVLHHLNKQ